MKPDASVTKEYILSILADASGGRQSHIYLINGSEFDSTYAGKILVLKILGVDKGLDLVELDQIIKLYDKYLAELRRIDFPTTEPLRLEISATKKVTAGMQSDHDKEWHLHSWEIFKGPGRDIKHELLNMRENEAADFIEVLLNRYRSLITLLYSLPMSHTGKAKVAIDFKPDNFVWDEDQNQPLMIDTYPPKCFNEDGLLYHFAKLDPNFTQEQVTLLCSDIVWMSARIRRKFLKIADGLSTDLDAIMTELATLLPQPASERVLEALSHEFSEITGNL